MPKVEIDYSNTIIYKITCKDPNITDVYVGHTTNFVQRKHSHKQSCINEKASNYSCKLYETIRNNGGWTNWKMEIVNFFECKDHYEARKKEQEYFVLLNATLNSIEPMPKPKVVTPVEKVKIEKQVFFCQICNVKFDSLKLFDIHKNTKKHTKKQNDTNLVQLSSSKFCCKSCDYYTSRNSQYERHLSTKKHIEITKGLQNTTSKFNCICGNKYNYRQNLYRHKISCQVLKKTTEENPKNTEENIVLTTEEIEEKQEVSGPVNTTMILELLKQNNEFKELLIEQNKKILELVGNSSVTNNITNNNTMNNKFNLQIFLNEKCKDAFNIDEFIDGVNVVFKDFENFGKVGYVSSINNILIRELKGIDIYKRPIHCSDLKREVIHVKDNNVWVKDEDKKYMKRAIRRIEHKNIQLITEYAKAYPEVNDATSKRSDEYDKMMYNSMGESTDEGNERNYEKIIRTVAKEILIDKEK